MTEEIFNQKKQFFEDCLTQSGYNYYLKYVPDPDFGEKRVEKSRTRNVTYYNPP